MTLARTARVAVAAVAAVLLALAVGCSSNDDGSPDEGVDTTTTTVLSPQLLDEVSTQIATEIEQWLLVSGAPGVSLAVVAPGGVELVDVGGVSDLPAGTPVTPDDNWRLGSLTKPFTSAVIYLLADEGAIELDAPVSDYLGAGWAAGYEFGGVDYGDQLTVKQMLNYSSGFVEYATSPAFFAEALTRLDRPIEPEEIIAFGVEQGPQFQPGTESQVTTIGHLVAGLLIEKVTGRPAAEVIRERVFDKVDASAVYLSPQEIPPEFVVNGYLSEGFANAMSLIWPADGTLGNYDEVRARAEVQGTTGPLFNLMVVPQELLSSVGWTGGGLEGHPVDTARAWRALFDGTVLSPGLAAAMTETATGSVYGQGVVIRDVEGERAYQQSGVVPGYNSGAVYLPEWDIAVVASSNTESPGLPVQNLVNAVAIIVRTAFIQAATDAGS
jgi:CubicO group peptidase (beta-lactamase class C family)